jgi:carbamoylphosphate synthase large subunit
MSKLSEQVEITALLIAKNFELIDAEDDILSFRSIAGGKQFDLTILHDTRTINLMLVEISNPQNKAIHTVSLPNLESFKTFVESEIEQLRKNLELKLHDYK